MKTKEYFPIVFLIISSFIATFAMCYNMAVQEVQSKTIEIIESSIEKEYEPVEEIIEEKKEIKIQGRYFDENKYLDSSLKVSDTIRAYNYVSHIKTVFYKSSIVYELQISNKDFYRENKLAVEDNFIQLCIDIKNIWLYNGYEENIYLLILDPDNADKVLFTVENGDISF